MLLQGQQVGGEALNLLSYLLPQQLTLTWMLSSDDDIRSKEPKGWVFAKDVREIMEDKVSQA